MQSGRPSESSSRHRWGKYNSRIGSPKVASGPLLSEVFGLLPLEMTKCHVFFFCFMQDRESCWASLYYCLSPPRKRTPVMLHIFTNINCLLSPDCLCARFSVIVDAQHPVCLTVCFIWALVGRWLRGPLIKGRILRALTKKPCTRSRCFSSPLAPQLEPSLFNRLWLMALTGVGYTRSLFFSFVCETWDQMWNARDILFPTLTLLLCSSVNFWPEKSLSQ